MKATPLSIPDVLLIEPRVFEDERGSFYESYNQQAFDEAAGYPVTFVQDNHSLSVRGTLRGLHYQLPPNAQGKLVRVTKGEAFDVAVDVRTNSPTFGQWVGQTLSANNRRQIWIPPGFAHGFLATSDVAEVQYKCTDFYAPGSEASIRWDDAELGIDWPIQGQPLVSVKDARAPSFGDVRTFND